MATPGFRLGNYEFVESIDSGGMGEVWCARDTRLGRTVAIKTLPPEWSASPERLARLRREAQLLASLNHPNVASIHGLEEDAGTPFLVLELVEGETLEQRLERGPIPLDEAIDLALQIATALESAHEHGIVHRDLKPANIKITRDGRVKVLDFGLAKQLHPEWGNSADTPTLTRGGERGSILGTPAYMSPEQARGEDTDTRADIWAFGTILVEMLTGRPLFRSPSAAETLARVIEKGPVEMSLPSTTPPLVARLVRRCLRRNPAERLRHIGDARIDLEDSIAGALEGQDSIADSGAVWSRRRVVTAAAIGVAAAATGGWYVGRGARRAESIEHYALASPSPISAGLPRARLVGISPDGRHIAYADFYSMHVHSANTGKLLTLDAGVEPFFSPDSQRIAYFRGEGPLVSVPVDGGDESLIAHVGPRPLGGSWGRDGRIYYAHDEGIFVVPEDGRAEPKLLFAPDSASGELYGWPEVLPGERKLLFTVLPAARDSPPLTVLLDLETGANETLTRGERARYVSSGHLIVADQGELVAIGLDLASSRVVSERRTFGYTVSPTAPSFDISATGTLVYLPPSPIPRSDYVWVDPETGAELDASLPRTYAYPRVSPDGNRLVGDAARAGNLVNQEREIFVWDFARRVETQLTNDAHEDLFPNWGPDGRTVYFTSRRGQVNMSVFARNADRSDDEPRLIYADPEANCWLMQVSPASRSLLIEAGRPGDTLPTRFVSVDLEDPSRVTELLHLPAGGLNPNIAPSGELMAYQSNETGRTEVWVRSLSAERVQKRQVSAAGGRNPRWSSDGQILYFQDFAGAMQRVEVRYGTDLEVGRVVEVFPNRGYAAVAPGPLVRAGGRPFDIGADGRILTIKVSAAPRASSLVVVRRFSQAI